MHVPCAPSTRRSLVRFGRAESPHNVHRQGRHVAPDYLGVPGNLGSSYRSGGAFLGDDDDQRNSPVVHQHRRGELRASRLECSPAFLWVCQRCGWLFYRPRGPAKNCCKQFRGTAEGPQRAARRAAKRGRSLPACAFVRSVSRSAPPALCT